MKIRRVVFALAGALLLWSALPLSGLAREDTTQVGKIQAKEPMSFPIRVLEGEVVVLPGVFHPLEAERVVLPFMEANERLFQGKVVMESGKLLI